MPRNHGFVLIVVIGLLGVLAIISVGFVQKSRSASEISRQGVQNSKAALLVRSGYEYLLGKAAEGQSIAETLPVGRGSFRAMGDVAVVSMDDTSKMINVNDGIEAGRIEMGSAYDATALDPWPEGSLQTYHSASAMFYSDGTNHYFLFNPPYPSAQAGDVVEADGWSTTVLTDAGWGTIVLNDGSYPGGNFVSTTVALRRNGIDFNASGLINLRLRRTLNAYGDVHRFLAKMGEPDSGNYGQSFVPTDSSMQPLDKPIPGGDGLGDYLIERRPANGYSDRQTLLDHVRAWGEQREGVDSGFDADDLVENARRDLTLKNFEDDSSTRLLNVLTATWEYPHSFAMTGAPLYQELGHRLLRENPIDFTGMFGPTSVSPVNFDGASFEVKASLLAAVGNVEYLFEGAELQWPYEDQVTRGDNERERTAGTTVAVAPPVMDPARNLENGNLAGGQSWRFMSYRDALGLARQFQDYGAVRNFDGFQFILQKHRANTVMPYEKAVPQTDSMDPRADFNNDPMVGYFTQDYVEVALPHVMGDLRRVPGFMGAPAALTTPYVETDARPLADLYDPGAYAAGRRTVADLVRRQHHPKIMFQPGGIVELTSRGEVRDPDGVPVARKSIAAVVRAFEWNILRNQAEFEAKFDSTLTDGEGLIGPNRTTVTTGGAATATVTGADTTFGFLGLKDRLVTPYTGSQVVMNFNKDTDPADPGSSYHYPDESWGIRPYPGRNPPTDADADPFLSIDIVPGWEASPHGYMTDGMRSSSLEDVVHPAYGGLERSSDVSPFGGVLLGSSDHGTVPVHTNGNWSDSIYWRLQNATAMKMMDNAQAMAETARRGVFHVWVRIPSDYDNLPPRKRQGFGQPWQLKAYTHMIGHVDIWQKKQWPTGPRNGASFCLAYRYEPDTGERSFIARYDVDWGITNGHTGSRQYYAYDIGYPLVHYVNNSMLPIQTDYLGLHTPDNQSYSRWIEQKARALEKRVVLKDLPEAGPGTWHKLTMGWDIFRTNSATEWSSAEWPYDDRLWLKVHNESVVDKTDTYLYDFDTNYHYKAPATTPIGSWGQGFGEWFRQNSNPVFALGEKHAREHTNPGAYFYPCWRLNSVVDNVELTLGSLPFDYKGPSAPGYGGEDNLRFDIRPPGHPSGANEPGIHFDPGATGQKVLFLSARVFNPPDEKAGTAAGANHPRVDVELVDTATTTTIAGDKADKGWQTTYTGAFVADATRVVVTWRGTNPEGNALIDDGSDDWTMIPWVEEVRWAVSPSGPIELLSWSQD